MKLKPWQWLLLAVCAVVSAAVLHRDYQIAEGQKIYDRLGCATCHLAGGAPSLEHVGRKYDRQTFVDWLSNPETIYARLGRKPLNAGYPPMPRLQEVSHRDIELLSYLLSAQR